MATRKPAKEGLCRFDLVSQGRCRNKALHVRIGSNGLRVPLCHRHNGSIGQVIGVEESAPMDPALIAPAHEPNAPDMQGHEAVIRAAAMLALRSAEHYRRDGHVSDCVFDLYRGKDDGLTLDECSMVRDLAIEVARREKKRDVGSEANPLCEYAKLCVDGMIGLRGGISRQNAAHQLLVHLTEYSRQIDYSVDHA